jgi:hypothetical protein
MAEIKRIRVTRQNPCPVCGRTTWCLVAADGSDAICPRTPSGKEIKGASGAFVGYLHILTAPSPLPPRPRRRVPEPPVPAADFATLSRDCAERADRLDRLAAMLGVSESSLVRLGVGQDGGGRWTFPMRDGRGRVIGIRLRTDDGRKFCIPGSRNGLFIPDKISVNDRLYLCEGPTDCAALLDLGISAIGRPMAMGCEEMVIEYMRPRRREAVVVADHDDDKTRPDGSVYNPGMDGAARLLAAILPVCRRVCIIKPPFSKDVRGWKADGMTRAALECVVKESKWHTESKMNCGGICFGVRGQPVSPR